MKHLKPFLFAAALLGCSAAHAVPAYPGLMPFTQPDGTTILVQSGGDEWSHYLLSEDGYLLTWVDGALCYADTDAQGKESLSHGCKDALPYTCFPHGGKIRIQIIF